jgi:hypothetical protein
MKFNFSETAAHLTDAEVARQVAKFVRQSVASGCAILDLAGARDFNDLLGVISLMEPRQREATMCAIGCYAVSALCDQARAALQIERALVRARVPRESPH